MGTFLFILIMVGFLFLLIPIINSKCKLDNNQIEESEDISIKAMLNRDKPLECREVEGDFFDEDNYDEPYFIENEIDSYEREGYGICELDEYGRNIWEDEC
jgi:hypothetical protein